MTSINKNFINLVNLSKFGGQGPAVFLDTIDSVSDMLQGIGYQTKITSNVILNDAINILWGVGSVFSPTYDEIAAIATPKNSIIFNMEQMSSNSTLVTAEYIDFLSKYTVLDYNQLNLSRLNELPGFIGYEFPLIPSKNFISDYPRPNSFDKKFDFGFYGIVNQRRQEILKEILSRGLTVKIISGAYGSQLPLEILDCKAILNLHFYESSIFEVARCLRPVAMGVPIISEKSKIPNSVDWTNSGIHFVENENFVNYCVDVIRSESKLLESAQQSFRFIFEKFHSENLALLMNKLNTYYF